MPLLWEGLSGPVTQLRTGTSSPEFARGSKTDMMPFNKMPEFTKEITTEMLLLISCQIFVRKLQL